LRTIEVVISSSVRPTERVDRVVSAIENIFQGLVMDIRADRIEAYDGPDSLKLLHELLEVRRSLTLPDLRCSEDLLAKSSVSG